MKIELIKTKDKHLKGWKIIPENQEEKRILGSIRNAEFWGFDDTHPTYDGCKTSVDNEGKTWIEELKYAIPKYKEDDKIKKRSY